MNIRLYFFYTHIFYFHYDSKSIDKRGLVKSVKMLLLMTALSHFRCFSYLGKVQLNGQDLSIGSNCDYIYIVEHEFLHALGFYHEQSRSDRDDYVTIVKENIQEGLLKTLIKHASSLYVQDYIKVYKRTYNELERNKLLE